MLIGVPLWANNSVVLNNNESQYAVSEKISYYIDNDSSVTIDELLLDRNATKAAIEADRYLQQL